MTLLRSLTVTACAALLLLPLAACSSGGSKSATATPPTSPASSTPLRNASSARASDSAAASATATLGQPFALGPLTITISSPVLGGDDAGPWITVQAKIENHGTEHADAVNPGIVCAGASEAGGSQAGSTLHLQDGFPANSVDQGTLNLLVTGDARTGTTVPPCQTPAAVQISPLVTGPGLPGPVRIPLPDALIQQLNAKR